MEGNWCIIGNHLAVKSGDIVYHLTAKEVYSAMDGKDIQGISCGIPSEELPNLRYSKFGTEVSVRLGNETDGMISIKVYAVRRGEEVPVDVIDGRIIDQCVHNGTWFYLSGNVQEVQDTLSCCNIKHTGTISMRQYLKLVECDLLSDHKIIHNDVSVQKLESPIDETEKVPSTLQANLFQYQKTGYLWLKYMLEETQGCILGDEMGLGKTMQVITEMLYLKARNTLPVIVIAPISLLVNWKRECEKFAPVLHTHIHHGQDRAGNYKELLEYDIIITSYTTVISDIHMLNMISWELVVLDEAQSIKNPYSQRTKACKALRRIRSLAVSGTPFENHVTDIWSLVDFIQPGLLGTLQKYNEIVSDDTDGAERIEPILTPLMLRRLVNDVAKDLPPKVVSAIPIQMSEEECNQYSVYAGSRHSCIAALVHAE